MFKKCNSCNADNLEKARYCISCESAFATASVTTVPLAPKALPRKVISTRPVQAPVPAPVDDLEFTVDDEVELANYLLNQVEDKIQTEAKRPVKYEDTMFSSKSGRTGEKQKSPYGKKSGKTLLSELGGNDPEIAQRLNK